MERAGGVSEVLLIDLELHGVVQRRLVDSHNGVAGQHGLPDGEGGDC